MGALHAYLTIFEPEKAWRVTSTRGRSVQDGTLSTKSLRTYLRLGLLPREPECIISANVRVGALRSSVHGFLSLNTEPMNRAVGGPHLYSVRHVYKKNKQNALV